MRVRSTTAVLITAAVLLASTAACSADDDPTATITAPPDGTSVAGRVVLAMTADGITIEEAGTAHEDAGHFHVIADDDCVATGDTIPKDADHLHLGKGQSEGAIFLETGTHELCLQVGDGEHSALDVTDRVTVEVGVTDLEQWCAVVGDVDRLFESTDTADDEFAVKQVGYENIRRLISQLLAAIDLVDPGAREDVHAALAFGSDVATTLATAADERAAETALTPTFEAMADGELPGADWILDTCGVHIDE